MIKKTNTQFMNEMIKEDSNRGRFIRYIAIIKEKVRNDYEEYFKSANEDKMNEYLSLQYFIGMVMEMFVKVEINNGSQTYDKERLLGILDHSNSTNELVTKVIEKAKADLNDICLGKYEKEYKDMFPNGCVMELNSEVY